ncbi:hypothetical protein PG985_012622 [Apiospora marii]|uniref:uncharacterized protein n=1 Tax=Apiospora marii TaxID=335849 RepID=UPI0031328444
MKKVWAEIALGQLQLSVAAILVLHRIRVVTETEETVYSQVCQAPRSTTGESYKDMTTLVYSMKDPEASRVSNHQRTSELPEADELAFYILGHILSKLVQTKELTEKTSWPPPTPEIGLYHMDESGFLRGESYQRKAHADQILLRVSDQNFAEVGMTQAPTRFP